MVVAVRVHKVGGPEVLTVDNIEIPAPGEGQIKIKQHACGVNFIDTYFRTGSYQTGDSDDRLWAAAEMWETTGSPECLQDFQTRAAGSIRKIDEKIHQEAS